MVASQVVVGIGGGSGSGKSTIAALLRSALEPRSVLVVNQDQFFRPPVAMPTYHSTLHGADRPDFNHPGAFDRVRMIEVCRSLDGHDVVIIEGILVLHFPELRSLLDLACYVDVELPEMLQRRTERNLARGYGGDRTEIEYYNAECVTPEHLRFNAPTARFADIVIPNGDGRTADRDHAIAAICDRVSVLEKLS